METFETIRTAAGREGLAVVGAFHPDAADMAPEGTATLVLLGPVGPGLWAAFSISDEAFDGAPHPMDRWSRRIIDVLAAELGGSALFPFGGPPWHPFQHWAARGEGVVSSPVAMQASPTRGLWASYRGALAFTEVLDLPDRTTTDPCGVCGKPCETACPVDAFAGGVYDVPKCTAHVQSSAGEACRHACLVRRACPAGAGLELPDAQRAFHMNAFLSARG